MHLCCCSFTAYSVQDAVYAATFSQCWCISTAVFTAAIALCNIIPPWVWLLTAPDRTRRHPTTPNPHWTAPGPYQAGNGWLFHFMSRGECCLTLHCRRLRGIVSACYCYWTNSHCRSRRDCNRLHRTAPGDTGLHRTHAGPHRPVPGQKWLIISHRWLLRVELRCNSEPTVLGLHLNKQETLSTSITRVD